jgi:hypothetical protein
VKDLRETMELAAEAAHTGASIFATWDAVAGVRQDETLIQKDRQEVVTKRFFPAEIVPHLQHPSVLKLDGDARRYLEAQHLFQWLLFTVQFELKVVNPAALNIAEDVCGFAVQKPQRRDAMRVLVDEQYHAQYTLDVADQLQEISGIDAVPLEFANYHANLNAVAVEAGIDPSWAQFVQVAIFETLVTTLLLTVPDDPTLITVVRDTVKDHVADEVRHHAYFSLLFKSFWQQLTSAEQVKVAQALPDIIVRSLAPNTSSAAAALTEVGLSAHEVREILSTSYSQERNLESASNAAKKTMAMFARAGVFSTPGATEAFARAKIGIPDRRWAK